MSRKQSAARQEVEAETEIKSEIKTDDAGEIVGAVIGGTEVIIEKVQEEAPKELSYDELLLLGEDKLVAKFGNKSNAIRALALMNGGKCGPISKALNIRFQHARNVLSKPLKRVIAAERAQAAAAAAKTE